MSLTLNGDQNSRKDLSVSQFYKIRDNYNNGHINKHTAIGTRYNWGIQMSKYIIPKFHFSTSKYIKK